MAFIVQKPPLSPSMYVSYVKAFTIASFIQTISSDSRSNIAYMIAVKPFLLFLRRLKQYVSAVGKNSYTV